MALVLLPSYLMWAHILSHILIYVKGLSGAACVLNFMLSRHVYASGEEPIKGGNVYFGEPEQSISWL